MITRTIQYNGRTIEKRTSSSLFYAGYYCGWFHSKTLKAMKSFIDNDIEQAELKFAAAAYNAISKAKGSSSRWETLPA